MKKISAIFFLLLFISTTELKELFRVPVLVDHFLKHKDSDRSMSVIDFLKIHYVGEKQDDNDDQEDGQLPFKGISESTVSSFFSGEHFFVSGTIIPQYTGFRHNYFQSSVPINFGNSLFRPPRLS